MKMFAIIETGGKQYRVSQGAVIEIEKLDGEIGDNKEINNILLLNSDDGKLIVGHPYVDGSSVKVTILDQAREKKIRVFKFKQRKRYRRTQGHRQYYSKVRVDTITIPQQA
jgi:large subunit ribosomal protein L21